MSASQSQLVMAIYPNTRGFAYVVFEGPLVPVDWGVSDVRGKRRNTTCIRRIGILLKRYAPDVVILRGGYDLLVKRGRRLNRLVGAIEQLVAKTGISSIQLTRAQIKGAFVHLRPPTRYAIVNSIARYIPDFQSYVPPVRKIWQREDRWMGLFDAAALAFTFYRSLQTP